jgi:menaquinone-dependent protoporphyrinogen IX oxidase
MRKPTSTRNNNKLYRKYISLLLAISLVIPVCVSSEEDTTSKTLIIYYSRTGKTKLISEILNKHTNSDLVEIQDPKDRSGTWGYIQSATEAFRHKHAPIEPEQLDMAAYSHIIVASPVWSWNLCTPIHTLFEKNRFDGKKLVLITTANIHIMKYEPYGDDAPFIKKFLRDYLRGKRQAAVTEVVNAGGKFIGHYHFETKAKSDDQLVAETMKCVDYVKGKIAESTKL